jgi:hypothetical protein
MLHIGLNVVPDEHELCDLYGTMLSFLYFLKLSIHTVNCIRSQYTLSHALLLPPGAKLTALHAVPG